MIELIFPIFMAIIVLGLLKSGRLSLDLSGVLIDFLMDFCGFWDPQTHQNIEKCVGGPSKIKKIGILLRSIKKHEKDCV